MPSVLKPGEHVTLYTTAAWPVGREEWAAEVHGLVYEKHWSPVRALLLRRLLGLHTPLMSPEERVIFRERIVYFTADHKRGKSVTLSTEGGRVLEMLPTEANGHFYDTRYFHSQEAAGGEERLVLRVRQTEEEGRSVTGQVLFYPDNAAPLIISDIDDTMKQTRVRDRGELKRNTFCRLFRPVEGMAAVYRGWAEHHGAHFHYVSGSPWQLYEPLEEFFRESGFPPGAWHLKHLRFKEPRTLKALFGHQAGHKLAAIEPLLARWPQRPLVLIGDTSDHDPEIYGELARRHPHRVSRLLLHDTTGEPRDAERYQLALHDVPPEKWTLFRDATELPSRL